MFTTKKAAVVAALLTASVPVLAHASVITISGDTSFARSGINLFGPGAAASGFSDSFSVGPSAARIFAEAEASSGSVRVDGNFRAEASFDTAADVQTNTQVRLNLGVDGSFDTSFGAAFSAGFDSNIPGIGLFAPFNVIDTDYLLETSGRGSGFGQTFSDRDSTDLVGVGVPSPPVGVFVEGSLTANADQTSAMTFQRLEGELVAKNTTTGTERFKSFTVNNTGDLLIDLNLDENGTWALTLDNLVGFATFSTDLGLSVTAAAGFGVGLRCGDLNDDDDNVFCADAGTSIQSEPLNLASIDPFTIGLTALSSIEFGEIEVTPLPGAIPFMISGLAALRLARRRRTSAA